jgi:hypothetical protein
MDTAGSSVHFSTELHDANQWIATAVDGDNLARKAEYGCVRLDSALAGLSRETCVIVTSQHKFWHAICRSLEAMENIQPHIHEPVGQETVPMARCRELTLLDVIQAVSEVAENDQEIIATVAHLIGSGQVRLSDEAIAAIDHLVATVDTAA